MQQKAPRNDSAVTQPETASEIANFTPAGVNPPPLLTLFALALATALSLFSILDPDRFMQCVQGLNTRFMQYASDGVVVVSSLLLVGCFGIALSPLGNIRLGAKDSTPEFSTVSWISMLFAAGMGAGLLYWGVAEPITHLASPPPYPSHMAEVGNARMAMVISYLHWSLHPWGIYAAGALCLAYFSFCKGHSLLPSAPFRAVLPKRFRISHATGDVVDVACVISMLLGLSASMAAGTMQIASGTKWLGNTATTGQMFPTYLSIIVLLVTVYLLSASTSIHKGIKRLSEINMMLAVLLAFMICIDVSVTHVLATLAQSIVDYFRFLPELSFTTLHSATQPNWSEIWTANYFLSWIAWVPFVGIFVARISRGRTIRQFVLGVALAPSLFTFVWFAILGSAALDVQLGGVHDLAADIMADSGAGLFSLLSTFPAAQFLWGLVILLVFIFLVTSADSASYVLAMMAGRGEANPSTRSKLFWGIAIATLTTATLFSESGIHSVRAVFSFAGIAVFFILAAQMLCLAIGLLRHSKT
jgi:glycine betaine transporter